MPSQTEKPSGNQKTGDFFKKYGKYILIIAIVVVLIIIIVLAGRSRRSKNEESASAETEEIEEVIDLPDTAETEEASDPNALKEDAYPEINLLITTYFEALRDQDLETLSNIMETSSEITAEEVEKEGEYIEDYRNIKCYTRDGLIEDTYVVFAYYEIKFLNVDTLAPSMIWMYVCTNEDGTLYINKSTIEGEVASYIDDILQSDEVNDLAESVNDALATAMEEDDTLAQLVTKMKEGADPTIVETEEETEPEEEEAEETEEAEQTDEAGEEEESQEGETVYALQTVNIRESASTDSDLVGQLPGGESIIRTGTTDDWSIVIYNGKECYIKTEFLTTESSDGYFQETDETVEALQNVKMRSSASVSSEDLGTLTGGTKVHRTGYNEEWSRIEYNGRTCYVASEYLR